MVHPIALSISLIPERKCNIYRVVVHGAMGRRLGGITERGCR